MTSYTDAVTAGKLIPELELEFYRRYLERRLLSYQARGTLPRHQLLPRTTDRGDQELQPMGPVIVCIDTSGSMGGYPEQCAKALALALFKGGQAGRIQTGQTRLDGQHHLMLLGGAELVEAGPQGLQPFAHTLVQCRRVTGRGGEQAGTAPGTEQELQATLQEAAEQ